MQVIRAMDTDAPPSHHRHWFSTSFSSLDGLSYLWKIKRIFSKYSNDSQTLKVLSLDLCLLKKG